jgi:hypothetical protein
MLDDFLMCDPDPEHPWYRRGEIISVRVELGDG